MILIQDFFNTAASALDKKYFPKVNYYRDNVNTTTIHHTLENFNNGVTTYDNLIRTLAKACNDTEENIHKLVSEFVTDFENYNFISK